MFHQRRFRWVTFDGKKFPHLQEIHYYLHDANGLKRGAGDIMIQLPGFKLVTNMPHSFQFIQLGATGIGALQDIHMLDQLNIDEIPVFVITLARFQIKYKEEDKFDVKFKDKNEMKSFQSELNAFYKSRHSTRFEVHIEKS